jgi:hypothetical protein
MMTNPDDLSSSIIDCIVTGKQAEANITVLRQVLSADNRRHPTQRF